MRANTEVMDQLQAITKAVVSLQADFEALNDDDLLAERNDLREQIETLKIEKSKAEEENARKLREVEHSTGLLRKQVDWEREKAVEEAKLNVQKENLAADRKRFEEQMAFNKEQIKAEIDRFESLLGKLMERLPTIKVGVSSNGH